MYTVEIGETVEPRLSPTNTYVLNLKYMHGDADHYTDRAVEVKDFSQLVEVVTFWIKWDALDWNYRCDLLDSYDDIKHEIQEFGISNPAYFIDNFFEYDVICHECGRFAHFNDLEIFWYNDQGIKHYVRVRDDNNQIVEL